MMGIVATASDVRKKAVEAVAKTGLLILKGRRCCYETLDVSSGSVGV
jgi:hypothetical protein